MIEDFITAQFLAPREPNPLLMAPWQYDAMCGVSTWSEADLPQWLRRHVWKDYRR